jgi:hypothetical protein
MPITPAIAAQAVIQSALFILASAWRTLSWSSAASRFLIRPSTSGGMAE